MRITQLRNLLTAVACLFAGVSAQAQFTATYEQRVAEANNYSTTPVEFSLSEVAAQLGTDTTTLVAACNSWTAEGSTDADLFFLTMPDGTLSADYTQGGKGGFWVNASGEPQAWSNDNSALRWYNTLAWDANSDAFVINIGQFPNQCSPEDVFTPKFVMQYNGKEATFDVTIKFLAKPEYDIPEPATLLWKELNIVDEITVDVNQLPFTNWSSSAAEVSLTEAAAKLGISDLELIENSLSKLVYATEYYITDDVALGSFKNDTLTNETSAGGLGFWLRQHENQETGDAIECCRAPYGESCDFYVENFSFDASTGVLTCNVGQYPNHLEGGKQYYTYIYLIYGDKAVSIRYNLNVELVERGTIDEYTIVGQTSAIVYQMPTTGYEPKSVRVKIAEIAEALECEEDNIELAALKDDVEFGGTTANNGGFWFNGDSYVISYGSSCAMFVEPQSQGNLSVLNVGQYPNYFTEIGQEQTVRLYFLNSVNHKAYALDITLQIGEGQVIEGEFQSVAQRTFLFQQVVAGYTWTQPGFDIPQEWIASNIGTEDWVLYAQDQLDENGNEKEGNAKYTTDYTMGEKPGFWFDKNGRKISWSVAPVFGMTAGGSTPGKIQMIQMPDGITVGDVYKAKVFFVNEENGKMVTVNLVYNIVEEVVEYENVGTEDIVVPVSPNDSEIEIDLTKAAEALGVTVDDLLSEDNSYLCGMTEGGTFSGGNTCADGLGFNSEGFFDLINGVVFLAIDKADGKTLLTAYSLDDIAEDFKLSTQFCFTIGLKQYVYNVRFVSQSWYENGISDIAGSQKTSGKIYDLSGRQVSKTNRGIYIMNGKKVVK